MNQKTPRFNRALVSVSDRTGLLEFLGPLVEEGLQVISTGGTAEFLKKNGLKVIPISDITQFPEVMGGRVKTLHPHVHMSLLARADEPEDEVLLEKYGLQIFDLVVVNLYPFENALGLQSSEKDLIEKIDIGGPSMLRSASKNFQRITVVCDPADYRGMLEKKEITLDDRKKLAGKVFKHTAAYDGLIGRTLAADDDAIFNFSGRKQSDLRYGENPQQAAVWYRSLGNDPGLHQSQILNGKPLSYNNLLDLDAAARALQLFSLKASMVAVKHNNPCGVGSGESIAEATQKAIQADPTSIFGAVLACNRKVDLQSARILADLFLECLVAPDFDDEAFALLAQKKNLRIMEWPELFQPLKPSPQGSFKQILGGALVQSSDLEFSRIENWKFFGQQPKSEILQDLIFAEKVAACLKSNAIAIVSGEQTLGLGMGQVNRVDAVAQSIQRWKKNHAQVSSAVLASDAFFPFADSIEILAQSGLKWVLQPGGSIKDNEVIGAAQKHGIHLVMTGTRHFQH